MRLESLLLACEIPPVPQGFAERVLARVESPRVALPPTEALRTRKGSTSWRRASTMLGMAGMSAAGLLIGMLLGHQTWRPVGPGNDPPVPVRSVTAHGWDQWIDPGDDALALTYLLLTWPRNG
jgi:hypothetical protein